MGILSYIQGLKDKTKTEAKGEEYIDIKDIGRPEAKEEVRVYTDKKPTISGRIQAVKDSVRVNTKKLAVYRAERQEKQRENMKQQIADNKLKAELQKTQAKLKPTGLEAIASNLKNIAGEGPPVKLKKANVKVQAPGSKKILNDPFPGGENPFG